MAKAKPALAPTRGERNNNPGNIDYNARNKWLGKLPRDTAIEPRFERFDSPLNGIRAAVRLVDTYKDRGVNSIRGVIEEWAHPNENRTEVYVNAVARAVGVDPDAIVDLTDYRIMRPLIEAIIRHENGRVIYTPAEIDEGLRRGGIVNPAAPAVPVPPKATPKKSAVASPGISAAGVASTAAAIASEPNLRAALEASGYLWPLAALGVAGVLLSAYVAWRTLRPKPEAA